MSEEFNEDREDEAVSGSSPLEEARKRIDLAFVVSRGLWALGLRTAGTRANEKV